MKSMNSLNSLSFQMHYSEKGREIARAVVESTDPASRSDASLISCLEQISGSPETTADEKLLAKTVTKLDEKIPTESREATRLCAFNAIEKSLPGPIGSVVAGVVLEASRCIGTVWERDLMTREALKALSGHHEAPPDVRAFAGFANESMSLGAQSVTTVAKGHETALKILTAPLAGPVNALCMNYLFEQEKNVAGLAYGSSMLHSGLRHFHDNPDTPPGRKALVMSAFRLPERELDDSYYIDNTRRSFLKALAHEDSDYLPSRVAKEILLHVDDLDETAGRNYVLSHTFHALRENPDSTALHKTLAQAGEELSATSVTKEHLLESQKAVMEAIAFLPADPSSEQFTDVIRELRGKITGSFGSLDGLFSAESLTHDKPGGAEKIMDSDDDFVYIDGLKLPRNSEESRPCQGFSLITAAPKGRRRRKAARQA
jgi:hypothetical protein